MPDGFTFNARWRMQRITKLFGNINIFIIIDCIKKMFQLFRYVYIYFKFDWRTLETKPVVYFSNILSSVF